MIDLEVSKLGYKAKDTITGYIGVVTAKAEFLFGTDRYEISSNDLHEGRVVPSIWVEEQRVKLYAVHTTAGTMTTEIELGEEVADTITGFKGTATGRYIFLNGCIRVEVTPKGLKDGKPIELEVFDEQRLTGKRSKKPPGGPQAGPPPMRTPKREVY